jgi:hypothetical protein
VVGMSSGGGQGGLETVDYRALHSVLLIARESSAAPWIAAAERAGCRIAGIVEPAEGCARIDGRIALDAVVAELEPGDEALMVPLFERLSAAVEAGHFGSVVSSPFELVDAIAAGLAGSGVTQLCEPAEDDRVEAIHRAGERRPPRLSDVNRAQTTARLQQLSEEVGRIAHMLQALSEDEAAADALELEPESGERPRIDGPFVRSIIRARRLRDQFFRSELFADPAWDMLLDLMAARVEKQRVAVSSLCIAAAVPPTTALRWIKMLCDQGLFVRVADKEDGRRVFIELSDDTAKALEAYLFAAQRIATLIV